MTGGRLPFRTGEYWHTQFDDRADFEFPDQVYRVTVDAFRGSKPGKYSVRIVAAEFATLDGRAILAATVDGTLTLTEEIRTGHDLPFPVVDFDESQRALRGTTQLRFTPGEGKPGGSGSGHDPRCGLRFPFRRWVDCNSCTTPAAWKWST